MSRYDRRHSRDTKGHGALGFLITFVLVAFVIVLVIFFLSSDDAFKGAKKKVYSVFYPQKYEQQVQKYAKEFGVEEPLIYSVIRTESGFRPEVVSSAGAMGLMQLMPSTFDWLQQELEGSVTYSSDSLLDPDVNIRYGTYLLSKLLKEHNGDIKTAAAAYNAGTANVQSWLSDGAYSQDGKTLSNIPFDETRTYVDRVSEGYEMYKKIYY